jgi:hypothetical protein
MILTPQCVGWLGDILIFGLQQVDYTQRKTTCKARKMTIFFIKFRHFCQNHCTGYHIYVKLKASAHTFSGARFAGKPKKFGALARSAAVCRAFWPKTALQAEK